MLTRISFQVLCYVGEDKASGYEPVSLSRYLSALFIASTQLHNPLCCSLGLKKLEDFLMDPDVYTSHARPHRDGISREASVVDFDP